MSGEYMHRQMRCVANRSVVVNGRRYRPGDVLVEGDKATDDFEMREAPEQPRPVVRWPGLAEKADGIEAREPLKPPAIPLPQEETPSDVIFDKDTDD